MTAPWRWSGLALALLLLFLSPTPSAAQATPDLILRNGHVITGDPGAPFAEALAIRDGRIIGVGFDAEISARAGPATRIIDLNGRTAIAGINDAHDHVGDVPFGAQAVTATPPMADPPLAEVVEAVTAAARSAPEGGWIYAVVGRSVMNDVPGTRAAIDAAGAGRPVILTAWWGHGVIANGRALEMLGIGEDVADMAGSHYQRDETGRLTGKMEEYAGWSALRTLHSSVGEAATVEYLKAYADRRLGEGVTSVQMMAGYQTPVLFASALATASLTLRVRVVPFPIPDTRGDGTDGWSGVPEVLGPRATVSGVKWVLDGTPIEQLAFQTRPYAGRPDWFGRPNFTDDHLRLLLQAALDGGEPLLLHVVGDAMVERVLTLMEALAPAERWTPLRVRIEHANGLTGPRVDRARRLGIVIAQPRPTSPIRAWVAAGIPVAYGSDSGFPPFAAFAGMTDPANPNSVSREEALGILTRAPAFAEFAERDKGTLAPGMVADVVVLSQDPLTTPQERLAATRSLLTIVAGEVVYAAGAF